MVSELHGCNRHELLLLLDPTGLHNPRGEKKKREKRERQLLSILRAVIGERRLNKTGEKNKMKIRRWDALVVHPCFSTTATATPHSIRLRSLQLMLTNRGADRQRGGLRKPISLYRGLQGSCDVMSRTNWRYGVQQSEVPVSYMDYGNPYPVIRSELATGAFEWPLLLFQLLPGIHTNIHRHWLLLLVSWLTLDRNIDSESSKPQPWYTDTCLDFIGWCYRFIPCLDELVLTIHPSHFMFGCWLGVLNVDNNKTHFITSSKLARRICWD